jgi:hypothetical protein
VHIFALVTDVQKVVENLRAKFGDFKLAMLYNSASALDVPTNWNLIVSSDWTDRTGLVEATKIIAHELHQSLGLENRPAISRVTVLKTADPFVRDMTHFYPVLSQQDRIPPRQIVAGDVTEGAGFVFCSQPEIAV